MVPLPKAGRDFIFPFSRGLETIQAFQNAVPDFRAFGISGIGSGSLVTVK
jgi:hypothetical protein